jgi:hypothetical protein
MAAGGRDRYSALLRSLQAGQELPLYRRGRAITFDWHPVLWTLVRIAIVVALLYVGVRIGTQWWREARVDTWTGGTGTVQSGVRLADCAIVDIIRVDEFPSWISYEGSVFRYTGWKRPFIGPDTPGYRLTGHRNGTMNLVLIDNTADGRSRDTILVWLDGALAGIEYARTPECRPPTAGPAAPGAGWAVPGGARTVPAAAP